MLKMIIFHQPIKTPVGSLYLYTDDKNVREIAFERDPQHKRYAGHEVVEKKNAVMQKLISQLEEYFAGKRRDFDLPLHIEGTPFQKKAWKYLASIPYGKIASYSDQAKKMGHTKAVRAVGSANGRNHIPIILPCHRVMRASGELGGYAGGLDMKRLLLKIEGHHDF
jgi:methylated-DNA-[protein]-cysteine S-methyltransferase